MCGLLGWVSKYSNGFSPDEATAVRELMWLTQLRGQDSTGVVQVTTKGEIDSLKRLGPPQVLMRDPDFDVWEKKLIARGRFMFGHLRAATRGTVTIDNAHPFYLPRDNGSPGITIVHNGTLPWQDTFRDYSQYNVDSMWMGHHIAQEGPEEVFSRIEGPIATIWWDELDQSLNVYRNAERPLYFWEPDEGGILINSELENIIWISYRHNILAKKARVTAFEPGSWYKYEGPDYNTPTITKIARKPKPKVTYPVAKDDYWDGEARRWLPRSTVNTYYHLPILPSCHDFHNEGRVHDG